MAGSVRTVAILNTSDDTVELLRVVLEDRGLIVVNAHLDDVRRAETSLVEFLEEHKPDAILYDLAPPYDRAWRFYLHLKERLALNDAKVVLTTTNKTQVERIVGITNVCEIVGKPYDLDLIADAVMKAANQDAEAMANERSRRAEPERG